MYDLAKELDLVYEESPVGKIAKQVATADDPTGSIGNIAKETKYNNIIDHTKCILGTVGSIKKEMNKVPNTKLLPKQRNQHLRSAGYFTSNHILQSDQFKLTQRLKDAATERDAQLEEFDIIEGCYEKHRGKLDKFQGEDRGIRNNP